MKIDRLRCFFGGRVCHLQSCGQGHSGPAQGSLETVQRDAAALQYHPRGYDTVETAAHLKAGGEGQTIHLYKIALYLKGHDLQGQPMSIRPLEHGPFDVNDLGLALIDCDLQTGALVASAKRLGQLTADVVAKVMGDAAEDPEKQDADKQRAVQR